MISSPLHHQKEQFWLDTVFDLLNFNAKTITVKSYSLEEQMNALSKVSLLLFLSMAFFFKVRKCIQMYIVTLVCISILYYCIDFSFYSSKSKKEPFKYYKEEKEEDLKNKKKREFKKKSY